MTNYVVLKRPHGSETWEQFTAISANSARSAIRQSLGPDDDSGWFVAVPARSWQPVAVSVETKTSLKFS